MEMNKYCLPQDRLGKLDFVKIFVYALVYLQSNFVVMGRMPVSIQSGYCTAGVFRF